MSKYANMRIDRGLLNLLVPIIFMYKYIFLLDEGKDFVKKIIDAN